MSIEYDPWTGWPSDLEESFKRRVSAYVRNCGLYKYKIGITNDPERRFRQPDYRHRYNKMIVMYQTNSSNSVDDMEKRLIEYYKCYCANEISGGGGPKGAPPFLSLGPA